MTKMDKKYRIRIEKCFSYQTVLLIALGIVINVIFPRLMIACSAPLYLDNIGSILVAALGGAVPGMLTAFISNYLGYFGEPSAIMFGLLTVAMAGIAAEFSERGMLRRIKGYLLLLVTLVVVGGAGGSVLGWYLYGKTVGGTIAAPYVFWLCDHGMSGFAAQFTGDLILDVTDKAITLLAVGILLHFYSPKWRDLFPISYIYACSDEELEETHEGMKVPYEGCSVYMKIIRIIVVSLIILSLLVTSFATYEFYHQVYAVNHNVFELFTYVVQTIGLEFAIIMLVLVIAGWSLYKTLKKPIDGIIRQIVAFGKTDPEKWLQSEAWKNRYRVRTGDEVQVLYDSACQSEATIAQKVMSIREDESILRNLSETDQMTGILNRGSGERKIGEKIAFGQEGILCVLDCDNFKQINDTFGHAVGDKVLIAVAEKMREVSRKDDVIFRLGGDEFAMFLSGILTKENAERFFERFFDAIRTIKVAELDGYSLSVSMGAVFYQRNQKAGFDVLYRKADEMLYECKKIDGFCAKIYE
ncbi:GGDEF domain-containing protein [Lachnospiraceae bacterium SGI.085]